MKLIPPNPIEHYLSTALSLPQSMGPNDPRTWCAVTYRTLNGKSREGRPSGPLRPGMKIKWLRRVRGTVLKYPQRLRISGEHLMFGNSLLGFILILCAINDVLRCFVLLCGVFVNIPVCHIICSAYVNRRRNINESQINFAALQNIQWTCVTPNHPSTQNLFSMFRSHTSVSLGVD